MEKEETVKNLSESVLLLAKLAILITDKFFATKLEQKIRSLVTASVSLIEEERSASVAQYHLAAEKNLHAINDILELLKELVYLNFINNSSLLFSAEQNLLQAKLEVVRKKKSIPSEIPKNINTSAEKTEVQKTAADVKKQSNLKLAGSKKQILDFIKTYPEIRTKDIIYEFNSLSGRTIKRNLTDLLRSGFVKKRVDNKAVYYSVAK